ncbi:MAG: hypothetical protein WD100_12150, partial [Tistlia sp.]
MRHVYPDAPRRRRTRTSADALASGLGYFSLALGAAELLAPGAIARCLGRPGDANIVRACGAREVLTGAGILASENPSLWLWGRVGGEALDVAGRGAALAGRNRQRRHVGVAMAKVAALMTVDLACARALSAAEAGHYVSPDYGDRSGFPKPASEMRGIAAGRERDDGASATGASQPTDQTGSRPGGQSGKSSGASGESKATNAGAGPSDGQAGSQTAPGRAAGPAGPPP